MLLCNGSTLNLGNEAGFLTPLNSSYTGWKLCESTAEQKKRSFGPVGRSEGLVFRETPLSCMSEKRIVLKPLSHESFRI